MNTGTKLTAAQMMKRAFLELLCKKSFTEITVTDVITEAEVARVSFYRNYSSTNEILEQVAEEFVAELTEKIFPDLSSSDPRKWRAFLFEFIYRMSSNQDYLSRLYPENISLVFSRIGDKLRTAEKTRKFASVHDKYRMTAVTGVVNSVVRHWIEGGMQETPEEIVDFLMEYNF